MNEPHNAGANGKATEIGPLPRWDLAPIFPSMDSPEFKAAFAKARAQTDEVAALFEKRGIRKREETSVSEETAQAFDEVTNRFNELFQGLYTLGSYLNCHVSTDATDEQAQSLASELRVLRIQLDQLWNRYIAFVGSLDGDALLAKSAVARDHEFFLKKTRVQAQHQMAEGEEAVASELQPMGLSGWARLHNDMTSLLTVTLTIRGEEQTLPMSAIRSLSNDADRAVRKAAYEAELKAWESVSVPLAAAMNGIKGYQGTVRKRRGWADDVEPTLLQNSIDRPTLEAMQQACVESFPDFRRYMKAKARALGLERLAWYDVNAPVGEGSQTYNWPQAEAFICEQFGAYSDRMREFADRSFKERWTDAEPRPGKEGGAYCTGPLPGISRILMNYDGSFNSVSTLAHELGHAYHNLNLKDRKPLQARTPSTLAETASIFCETIAFEAVLAHTQGAERLAALETSLQRDLMVVVDIHSRFIFEKTVFERRPSRELTVSEFNEIMLDAQRQTYGDGFDPDKLHPYMWAVKGHYYGPTFYNYPYTFGLLFGLGLYEQYRRNPEPFKQGYDDLLSSTGMADAPTLAVRFGIEVRSVDFWRSSLDVVRRNIAEFEKLTA
jgi:pepF/M3 family oligoendopeptidase